MSIPLVTHEIVTVAAGGFVYDHWESVQIQWSIENVEVQAIVSTTEVGPFTEAPVFDKWNFPPGTAIEIYAGDDLIFAGVVHEYQPSADAEQHSITLMCVTLSRDWAVSSVRPENMSFQDVMDTDIVQATARAYGLEIKDLSTGKKVEWFQAKQGATNFAEVHRVLVSNGKLIFAMNTGGLAITDGKAFGMGGSVVQGVNIKAMSAKLKDDYYYLHTVIGQNPIGVFLDNHLQPNADAINNRGRSKNTRIIDQRVTDMLQAQERANWNRNRNAGENMQAVITVPGWRDLDGRLWSVNDDCYVYAPWLQIDCVLRITNLVFTQNLSLGTITELTLMEPAAVGSSEATVCGGTVWGLGFNPAESVVDKLLRGEHHIDPGPIPWTSDPRSAEEQLYDSTHAHKKRKRRHGPPNEDDR